MKPVPIRQCPSLALPGSLRGSPPDAKLLTPMPSGFRPATGEVRPEPVAQATNAVLHPWLKEQLTQILDQCPPCPEGPTPGRRWSDWDYHEDAYLLDRHFPPVRVLLIWDNLKGHLSTGLVQ